MATYNSTRVSGNTPTPTHGLSGNLKTMTGVVACAAAPSTSDTLNFFTMPKNSTAHFWVLKATDMDTNGSPTLTLNVGDAGSANRIFSASTVGQAGTESSAFAAGGDEYAYTVDTPVTGVAAANAATGASGTVTLTVFYTMDGGAS